MREFIPRTILIKCETRRLARLQTHETIWSINNLKAPDILVMVHNQQKEMLTEIALLAGHSLYVDLLTDQAKTWQEGDIKDNEGQDVFKAPAPEVLNLIREIPERLLISPEKLRRATPSFLGERLFNFMSRGGYALYIKQCTCRHCERHLRLLERDPGYLWYI